MVWGFGLHEMGRAFISRAIAVSTSCMRGTRNLGQDVIQALQYAASPSGSGIWGIQVSELLHVSMLSKRSVVSCSRPWLKDAEY